MNINSPPQYPGNNLTGHLCNFHLALPDPERLWQGQKLTRLVSKEMLVDLLLAAVKVLAVGAGHYPLLDHARAAASSFHQAQYGGEKMLVWPFTGYELVRERFSPAGDHAGKWETSMLMHLDPGMTDLSRLPADRSTPPIGASNNGVQDASAAWGAEVVAAIVDQVDIKVRYLLDNYASFRGHGAPLFI